MTHYMEKVKFSKYSIDLNNELKIISADDNFKELTGYSDDDIAKGLTQKMLIFENEWQEYDETIRKALETSAEACFDHRLRVKNGKSMSVICYGNVKDNVMHIFIADITDTKLLKNEVNLMRDQILIQNSQIRMILEGTEEKIINYHVGNDICIIYAVENGDYVEIERIENAAVASSWEGKVYKSDVNVLVNNFSYIKETGRETSFECRIKIGNRVDYVWGNVNLYSIEDESTGKPREIIGRIRSIHKEKLVNLELRSRAERDYLTGLYNQVYFKKYIDRCLETDDDGECAFLMMDLDNFKNVNDTYGHYMGDKLIINIADMLSNICMHNAKLCRMGGDEFAVFFNHCSAEEVYRTADRILEEIPKIRIDCEMTAFITGSIGLTFRKYEDDNFFTLYKRADKAMYDAKNSSKNNWVEI